MAKKNNYDYFAAFETLSDLAVQESALLVEAAEHFSRGEDFKNIAIRAHELEHKGDVINHEIFNHVAVEFITPIEREDIISVSDKLDSVLDNIEEVFRCIYMYDIHELNEHALRFARIIHESCVALNKLMTEFKNFKKVKNMHEYIVKVNDYEEEADDLYFECMHQFFVNHKEQASYLLAWTLIFDQLEKCCDACEHVADSVQTVLLKNS